MNTELNNILHEWKTFLSEVEANMQLAIHKILNEVITNTELYALFFEYQHEDVNLKCFAIDKNENTLYVKYDILIDEAKSKTFFPNTLLNKEFEIEYQHRNKDGFEDIYDEYLEMKYEIFENWFMSCWDKIKIKCPIQKVFFSIHDTYFKINLNTKEEETFE